MTDKTIYALCEPHTKKVRYIGCAYDIHERYKEHLFKKNANLGLREWLSALKDKREKPIMIELENCQDKFFGNEAEEKWITFYRGKGAKLLNINLMGQKIKYKAGKMFLTQTSMNKLHILAMSRGISIIDYTTKLIDTIFSTRLKSLSIKKGVGRPTNESKLQLADEKIINDLQKITL